MAPIPDPRQNWLLAALGDVEIVERIGRTAEDIGDNLLEELTAEIQRSREGVVTVATPTDAVARFEDDSLDPKQIELLTRGDPGDPGPDDDHIEIAGRTAVPGRRRGLPGQCGRREGCDGRPGGDPLNK